MVWPTATAEQKLDSIATLINMMTVNLAALKSAEVACRNGNETANKRYKNAAQHENLGITPALTKAGEAHTALASAVGTLNHGGGGDLFRDLLLAQKVLIGDALDSALADDPPSTDEK